MREALENGNSRRRAAVLLRQSALIIFPSPDTTHSALPRHTLSNVLASTILTLQRFQSFVLPALDDHWLRDSLAVLYLEQGLPGLPPSDSMVACGPAALSAFFGLSAVMRLSRLHKRGAAGWLNRRDMEASLRELGLHFVRRDDKLPKCGLAIIQWEGPWSKRSFRGSNLAHSHWIAVVDGYVFDVMWGGWLPHDAWQDMVVEDIMMRREVQGWSVMSSYELSLHVLPDPCG